MNVMQANNCYLLGLFEGDGYQWTGTFGVTNRNTEILKRASAALSHFGSVKWRKDEKGFFKVCITSRPAKREFLQAMETTKNSLNGKNSSLYFAGKFDADGSRWKDRDRLKITYSLHDTIEFDVGLLQSIGIKSKTRKYKHANASDLEISSDSARKFTSLIRPFSTKMSSWND